MSKDKEPKTTEGLSTAYEVFGFSNVPLVDLKQILIDMGFTKEVEGDHPHNYDLSACAVAFPNNPSEDYPHQQINRITLGSGIDTDVVPVEILKDLKAIIPDLAMFNGTGTPIIVNELNLL